MHHTVEVLADTTALIQRSLDLILEKIETTLAVHDRFTIALSGGSTPRPLYEAIATHNLPWDKIHVFWGDERYVPPDHPDSNQRMARQAWLDKVSIPAANIHPMPTGEADPAIAARQYQDHLQAFFQLPVTQFPAFDVILLGMGDDGHTASLFPHTAALQVQNDWITVGQKDDQPRITFTAPLINQAHCVMFVVAGDNKRPALDHILGSRSQPGIPSPELDHTYPSRLIHPIQGELWWLLDQSAGQDLTALP